MGTANAVCHTTVREIERVILVLTGCNGDGCLVAPKNGRRQHRTVHLQVLAYDILCNM